MQDGICFMEDIRMEQVPVPEQEPLRSELEDFFAAIREGRPPVVDGRRALRGLETLALVSDAVTRYADSLFHS